MKVEQKRFQKLIYLKSVFRASDSCRSLSSAEESYFKMDNNIEKSQSELIPEENKLKNSDSLSSQSDSMKTINNEYSAFELGLILF